TGDLHLEVMESDGKRHYATTNMNKQAVKYYGSDIRYLKKITPNNLLKISLPLFSPLYFIIIVIAIAIFIAFIFYYRKRIKLTADIDRIRNKRASGVAKKRLKRAEKMMKEGNEEAFFTELIQTLWGYAADKLTINQTELSKDNIQNKLLNQDIDPVIAEQFIELIETCEYTRFAPKTEEFRMEKSYSDARSLIIAIENAR
ncbi:MAG: hypothetical protein RQ866_07825, partial [Bacteroidales bacterium]|nr:hypothetical protein [Bacteroidales bacterium]